MEKLNVAFIGLSCRGRSLMKTTLKFIKEVQIVAVCDVYEDRIQDAIALCEELGGYKGYGLALAVEFFSSILQDGSYGKALSGKDENGNIRPYHLGHWFIAIDTDHFMGEDVARKKAGDISRSIRASKKAPGSGKIRTAGEREYEISLTREDGVPINESVQKEITEVRDELGLYQYKFPWEE